MIESDASSNPSVSIQPNDIDEDNASLAAWTSFLEEYARGVGPPNPARPPLTPAQLSRLDQVIKSRTTPSFEDAPLYSSTTVTPELASKVRDFYCDNGYLPPPRAPWEASRERCIQEYDLYSKKQIENVQSVTDLASAYFPNALLTFTLFRDRIQTHFALSGPQEIIDEFKLHVGLRVPSEDSLCGHTVLLDRGLMFIPDFHADWRYKLNPFGLAGFKSFMGVPVALELDPLPHDASQSESVGPTRGKIAIGTLNICFTREMILEISPTQRLVAVRLASMLETQLRATWEGDRRRRDARARTELSNFIEEAMIGDVAGIAVGQNVKRRHSDHNFDQENPGEPYTSDLVQSLARKVSTIIVEADTVDVFDLRAFSSLSGGSNYFDTKTYPLQSLAQTSTSYGEAIQLSPTVVASLLTSRASVYDEGHLSGLELSLPSATKRHLAIPLADGDQPLYLILVTSTNPTRMFTVGDVNFIKNLGSILVAKSIQTRVMREDAAKTSFLSAISHELRTPMHAVTTAHVLMREAIVDGRVGDLEELLLLSESSSRTLTNILNDVLDYGKGTAGDQPENRNKLVPDLLRTVVQTVKVAESQYVNESSSVSISVEYDDRNWAVNIDEARFQRVLINGLTNAMKFCHTGSIIVRLRSQPEKLVVEIIDTGVGFNESEMPLVMQPFKKLDINSPGAGLGLHITKTMLEKAGGTLVLRSAKGEGTTFEATLPVSWATTDPPKSTILRRQIRPYIAETNVQDHVAQSESSPLIDNPLKSLPESLLLETGPTPEPEIKPEGTSDSLRVLIVDDNHICLALLSKSLRKSAIPIDLREASGGHQAVDVFREFHPELVLTDVSMPGLDGIAAAEIMREHEVERSLPRSAIYAVTALGATDSRSKSKGLNGSADLDGWLVKGQDLAHIARDIADRLSASGGRRSDTVSSSMVPSQTV